MWGASPNMGLLSELEGANEKWKGLPEVIDPKSEGPDVGSCC